MVSGSAAPVLVLTPVTTDVVAVVGDEGAVGELLQDSASSVHRRKKGALVDLSIICSPVPVLGYARAHDGGCDA